MALPPIIVCDIHPARAAEAGPLAQIVATCANDTGQPLLLKSGPPLAGSETLLTLHLPAEHAAAQHQVWCLACRLACFCPDARVSVLVHGAMDRSAEAIRAAQPA